MKICFATNNAKKIEEVKAALGDKFQIVSLLEIGCHEELPETGNTLEHNAFQKARYVKENYGVDCFADDTGLGVEALDGAPGVYSGR
ncbi:MAG TPA: non-canonical purine NTP pyrophosphatase, partial [Algoriphagus sp.]